MPESLVTFTIEETAESDPVAIAGGLVVAVRMPRSHDFVTVMIEPELAGYQANIEAPGLEIRSMLALGEGEETLSGEMRVGDANARRFVRRGLDCRITLQAIRSEAYDFVLEIGAEGSGDQRERQRAALIHAFNTALQAKDVQGILDSSEAFRNFAAEELALPEGDLREYAKMLYNRGVAFGKLGDREQSREEYSTLLSIQNKHHIVLRFQAKALLERGNSFADDEKNDEAIGDYDEIIKRYSHLDAEAPVSVMARALMNKATVLFSRGQKDETRTVVQEILNRWGSRTEPTVVEEIDRARKAMAELGG